MSINYKLEKQELDSRGRNGRFVAREVSLTRYMNTLYLSVYSARRGRNPPIELTLSPSAWLKLCWNVLELLDFTCLVYDVVELLEEFIEDDHLWDYKAAGADGPDTGALVKQAVRAINTIRAVIGDRNKNWRK